MRTMTLTALPIPFCCRNATADLCGFAANSTVDAESLISKGLVKKVHDGIKVLGDGEIDRPLVVKVHKCSQSASKKIIAAGGQIEEL